VQHAHYTADDIEVMLWDFKPEVEGVDEARADLFAARVGHVRVWLEQGLGSVYCLRVEVDAECLLALDQLTMATMRSLPGRPAMTWWRCNGARLMHDADKDDE